RGTEVLSIQYTNNMNNSGLKGVFIKDRLIAFVTGYYKGFGSNSQIKAIYRFVPKEMGEIVVYFL
ncbi:hypothetical protein BDV97DRAFT_293583, partial [Delphinella strobiligena]